MTDDATSEPPRKKITVERLGALDQAQELQRKLDKVSSMVEAVTRPALDMFDLAQPAIDSAEMVKRFGAYEPVTLPTVDFEMPEVRAARQRERAAEQTDQVIDLLAGLVEHQQTQAAAISTLAGAVADLAAEAEHDAGMTRVVLVLTVLAFVTSTAFQVFDASRSWVGVAVSGVLGIVVCVLAHKIYGPRRPM